MRQSVGNIGSLLKHLFLLLVVYSVCRGVFFLFNHSYFEGLSGGELFFVFVAGMRFDLSVIILLNFPFILFFLLPFAFRERVWYRVVLRWLYVIINSIGILANVVDFVYFPYILKRMDATVVNFFNGKMGDDVFTLLPTFFKDYWYAVVIGIGLCVWMYYGYRRNEKKDSLLWNVREYVRQSGFFIIGMGAALVGYRGGFQMKPLHPVHAGEHVEVKYIPLLINTPFNIAKTVGVKAIEPSAYWHIADENVLKSLYDTGHKGSNREFKRMNVAIIVLESFSKEYVGALNGRQGESATPFLDSLIGQSWVCSNAIANGKASIEGIPAIVAGMPTWMSEAYITSPYGNNRLESLPNLLKTQRYATAFFHGGTNGTMGFDAFARVAGYERYYGRKEYKNEKDYDGNWGIWDEEFLQFFAATVNTMQQPFLATVFTLTSHHPYPIPERYKDKFKERGLAIERSIAYTDYALQRFFDRAKEMPWYANTLFVLVADHTGISENEFYSNNVGSFTIPIVYYVPDNSMKNVDSSVTQQIDVLPSVLDYLHYPENYFAFGNSVFDTLSSRFALTHNSGLFQLIDKNYSLQFDGDRPVALYHYTKDSLLSNDVLLQDTVVARSMEDKIKAVIQTYREKLVIGH